MSRMRSVTPASVLKSHPVSLLSIPAPGHARSAKDPPGKPPTLLKFPHPSPEERESSSGWKWKISSVFVTIKNKNCRERGPSSSSGKREADGLKPIHSNQTSEPDRGNQVKKSLPAHSPRLGLRGLRGQSSAIHPEQDTEGTRPCGQKSPPSPHRHSAREPRPGHRATQTAYWGCSRGKGQCPRRGERKWPEALSGHVSDTGRTKSLSARGQEPEPLRFHSLTRSGNYTFPKSPANQGLGVAALSEVHRGTQPDGLGAILSQDQSWAVCIQGAKAAWWSRS